MQQLCLTSSRSLSSLLIAFYVRSVVEMWYRYTREIWNIKNPLTGDGFLCWKGAWHVFSPAFGLILGAGMPACHKHDNKNSLSMMMDERWELFEMRMQYESEAYLIPLKAYREGHDHPVGAEFRNVVKSFPTVKKGFYETFLNPFANYPFWVASAAASMQKHETALMTGHKILWWWNYWAKLRAILRSHFPPDRP